MYRHIDSRFVPRRWLLLERHLPVKCGENCHQPRYVSDDLQRSLFRPPQTCHACRRVRTFIEDQDDDEFVQGQGRLPYTASRSRLGSQAVEKSRVLYKIILRQPAR